MLSQFTPEHGKTALCNLDKLPNDVYPVGRLDYDSEGLLILTNDKTLNHKLLNPMFKHEKTYYVQVEGLPSAEELISLESGLEITVKGEKHFTLPAKAKPILKPDWIKERNPKINSSKPTGWISITITEGKNRQVRKMTAAINHPTLRLFRVSIEGLSVEGLEAGKFIELSQNTIYKRLNIPKNVD